MSSQTSSLRDNVSPYLMVTRREDASPYLMVTRRRLSVSNGQLLTGVC